MKLLTKKLLTAVSLLTCGLSGTASAYNLVSIESAQATYYYDSDFWGVGNAQLSGNTLTFRPTTISLHGDTVDPVDQYVWATKRFNGYASIIAVAKDGYQLNTNERFATGGSYKISPDNPYFNAEISETVFSQGGTYAGGVFTASSSAPERSDAFGSVTGWGIEPSKGNIWTGNDQVGVTGPKAVAIDTLFYLSAARYAPSGSVDIRVSHSEYTFVIGAVPEPETYAMLLAGLGVLGCLSRRRKHRI